MNLAKKNYSVNARAFPASDALHRHPGVVKNKQGALQRRPVVVKKRQGFPHYFGRVWLKKLVQENENKNKNKNENKNKNKNKIRLATWNLGTLTGKSLELIDTMKRRKINIACIQETKWKGEKAKEINGYKLWYVGKDNHRNGVGIMVDKNLKDKVVAVKRVGDRLILIKLVIGENTINIISAYAPQVGLDDRIKKQFWEDIDSLLQEIPIGERIFIGGDLNGHVGKDNKGYERVHGGYGFGERNEMGDAILDFAVAYDLAIANTYFKKRNEHLITFKSGSNKSQIDFFLFRKTERSMCKDCKVIPGESLTTQHRLLVIDIYIKTWRGGNETVRGPKVRWWNLKGEKMVLFSNKLREKGNWNVKDEVNVMWNDMVEHIKNVATEVLGVTNGKCHLDKETWWWNDDVQKAIREKRAYYKTYQKFRNKENLEKYKKANKYAKKIVSDAKNKAYDDLYNRLGTKEGEKDVFKIAKMRERKCRDINHVRCIKSEDETVLVKANEINKRWKNYFQNLLNNNFESLSMGGTTNSNNNRDYKYFRRIRISEVKEALKKMKTGKALGPDGIPIDVWKCMGEIGLSWLTNLFNKIIQLKKMPDEWRKSTVVPIYKNKGDIQSCNNYRGIKLMSHTMKLWERVIEQRLRRQTSVSENQFGFMPERSTMEAIHILRQLMEKFREKRRDLHMVFIDLEKAYDRVPRELIWWVLENKGVSRVYTDIIKDMYDGAITSVRTTSGQTSEFPITVGLHQGSALSPYLFVIIMDELTRHLQGEVPWCMLFADDIVLIDKTRVGVNRKLELWRESLESKGLKISRTKTEYMHCKFSNNTNIDEELVKIDGIEIPQTDNFRYLGSIIHENGDIEKDVEHRIKAGWMKWRCATGVLCDRRIPIKLKGKFYRTAIRPAMLYGTECWAVKKQHVQKMSVAEMRMLRWMSGKTRMDKIRNERIRKNLGVASIGDKIREGRLRWFGHVQRRSRSAPIRRSELIQIESSKKTRGRPKRTWVEVVRKDLKIFNLKETMVINRMEWRSRIHVADPI